MAGTVLVTGGAGFIGTHVVRALLQQGCNVRVLDSLIEQVHGAAASRRELLEEVDFHEGDIRDEALVRRALRGIDRVIHLAAEVGVGQSMYSIDRYVSSNDLGTAVLMQALLENPVQRIVVASSMSVYGEGLYVTDAGQRIEDATRPPAGSGWDPCDEMGKPLTPVPTPESKPVHLASVYAMTKYMQEKLVMTVAAAYGMEAVALRLFNVYGAGQALSNPYTGVLAIFASRLLNGQRPMIFEDGRQQRDFVHVADVAHAFTLALRHEAAPGRVFNIGSGRHVSIAEVAERFASAMERPQIAPEITGRARAGDIRHCFADITQARQTLGFAPRRGFEDSLPELADWVRSQQAVDRVAEARRELEMRGLVA